MAKIPNTTKRFVFKRSRYTCFECGTWRRLTLHHIKPQAQYPELFKDPENLQVLCRRCHDKQHKIDRSKKKKWVAPEKQHVWKEAQLQKIEQAKAKDKSLQKEKKRHARTGEPKIEEQGDLEGLEGLFIACRGFDYSDNEHKDNY